MPGVPVCVSRIKKDRSLSPYVYVRTYDHVSLPPATTRQRGRNIGYDIRRYATTSYNNIARAKGKRGTPITLAIAVTVQSNQGELGLACGYALYLVPSLGLARTEHASQK